MTSLYRNFVAWFIHVRRMMFQDMTGGQVVGRLLRSPVFTASLLGWASRIAQMGFQVLSVRLVIGTLGASAYAGVVLIAGLFGWIGNCEFGFSYGLMNTMSVAKAKGQNDAGLRFFAAVCYGVLSLLGIVAAIAISPFFGDRYLGAVPYGNHAELLSVSAAILVLVGTANIGNRLLFADQKIHFYYILSLFSTATSLTAMSLMHWGLLPARLDVIIAAIFGPQAFIGIIALAVSARPIKVELLTRQELRNTVFVSLKFFMLNLLTLLTVQTDTFVISAFVNAHNIATYGIYTRLFTAMNMLVTTPLGILWPRFSAHVARGERRPMGNLLASYIITSMGSMAAFGIFIYFCGDWIVSILAPHQNIMPPPYFILLLTLLQLSILWTGSFHTAVLSMSVLGPAILLTPVQALISIGGEWYLAKRFGIIGVTGGVLLSYIVMPVWLSPTLFWLILAKQIKKAETERLSISP